MRIFSLRACVPVIAFASLVVAASASAQSARSNLDTRFLVPANDTIAVTVELPGRTIPFATAYRTVRRVERKGRPSVELTYQWHGNDGSRTADTLWVDAADLSPLENHMHNGDQDAVTLYERSAAHTRYTATGKAEQKVDTTIAGRLYASAQFEELVRLARLAPDYSANYTLYYGPPRQIVRPASFRVVRSETVTGRNGKPVECWVVDAPLSEGLNTFYVSKADRRVVRLVNHEDPSAAFVFTK